MNPTEFQEQVTFIQYLEMRGLRFTAIPNSTYTPSMKQKTMNRRMGLRAGLPDVLVVLPTIGLVFIEMKRVKGGVVSPVQREWIDALNTCPGTQAFVCKGADEAIKVIERFMPSPGTSSIF